MANIIRRAEISLRSEAVMHVPPTELLFQISEDRLALLCKHSKDTSLEWAMCFFGAAFGTAQNVIYVLRDLYRGELPSIIDVLLAFVCVGSVAYGYARYKEHQKNETHIDQLEKKIREGKPVQI